MINLTASARLALLVWYRREKRDLPWRRSSDPYQIWVSEVMLQQTQVATVLPFFERWLTRFPTVEALASANEDEVLSCWQGLGYYRRCRFLHAGARFVVEHGLPQTSTEWLKTPGVGAYTAAAISSISFGEAAPLVDGNVSRVYARLTADSTTNPELDRHAWEWAGENLDHDSPGDWNQGLMELGATVCTPRNPRCSACPVANECRAHALGLTSELPKAVTKKPPVKLEHLAVITTHGDLFGIEQIPPGEWWEGMWRFPRDPKDADFVGVVIHTVTNHRIALKVYRRSPEAKSGHLKWLTRTELEEIAMPSPQRKALKLFWEGQGSLGF